MKVTATSSGWLPAPAVRFLLPVLLFAAAAANAQGNRPVVAVGALEVAAQNVSCEGWDNAAGDCSRGLALGFRVMLESAITKTGKMDVMERMQWETILTEQGLGEAGLTGAGGEIGGLTGVDYYVYGTITRFGAQRRGFDFEGLVGRTRLSTEMGVDLKVTDVATGRIVVADSVKATIDRGSRFEIAGYKRRQDTADPFADVQETVAAKIAEAVVTSRIPVKVIQVQDDGTLILNYGNVFFNPGDQLAAYEVGEQFIDPDTGEVLGSEETQTGVAEIVRAEPKFARARTVVGTVGAGTTLRRLVGTEKMRAPVREETRKERKERKRRERNSAGGGGLFQ